MLSLSQVHDPEAWSGEWEDFQKAIRDMHAAEMAANAMIEIGQAAQAASDKKVPECCECGADLRGRSEWWTSKGVCSPRCWADLYGEWDRDE